MAESAGGIRILLRVGTAGIPTRKNPFGAPGKSGRAVFAFYSPGPPLGSFTKEMQAFLFFSVGKQRALPRPDSGTAGGLW